MDNATFIESFRELKDSFVRLLDSISALRALSSVRVGGRAESALIESALAVLVQNQDLERCSVFMLQEDDTLVNVAGLDWDDLIEQDHERTTARPQSKVFRLGEGLIGLAAQSGEMQHAADCASDERFCGAGQAPRGSLIAVPILDRDTVLGVLNISHPHPDFFDESHIRTLAVFGTFLGQLLVNNRLVHKMDELVELRTRQLESALAEAQALKRRYEELSIVDELTTLKNRRFFFPETRTALARAVRKELPFSVLIADVDRFKQINDDFGHAAGDEVLKGVADELRGLVREGDILARFGGEEFALALPDTDADGALALAERIRECLLARSWRFPGVEQAITVSISIGISSLDGHHGQPTSELLDHLLREADQALYFGKQNGRDQSRRFCDIRCLL